jgi:quercetin dioxygenase-like cupin family protein
MMEGEVPEPRQDWPEEIRREFEAGVWSGRVGTRLVSETDRLRIWSVKLRPGERLPFHRHVLDYFWTAVTPGRARSHMSDGTTVEVAYEEGDTRHFAYGPGEYKIHDLENIGEHVLIFTTVEMKTGTNEPLPLS